MNATFYEKLVLVILFVALLAGAAVFHIKQSRSHHKIIIVRNAVKEEFTLKQVEALLSENRKININTASADELISIPRIGKTIADRIISYREKYGGFSTRNGLLEVDGIGPKKLEGIMEYIKIE